MAANRIKKNPVSKDNRLGRNGQFRVSGYHAFWGIVTPSKGIATKKDAAVINAAVSNVTGKKGTHVSISFKSDEIRILPTLKRETLVAVFEALRNNGKLTKEYTCVIITDKQFGRTLAGRRKADEPYFITKKQRAEMVTIS